MFIVFFIIFIFVFTVFENIIIGGIIFLLMTNIVMFFPSSKRKRIFFLLITATLLAFVSVAWKQYHYQKHIPNIGTKIVRQSQSQPQGKHYIGTGVIKDKQAMGRYIFEDGNQRLYLLHTEKSYQVGQELYIQANFKVALTGHAIYNIGENVETIGKRIQQRVKLGQNQESSSLRSGFFQYQFNYPKWMMMKGYYGNLYEKSSVIIKENTFKRYSIGHIKQLLQSKITQKYGKTVQAGLILGMLIGDRSEISKDKYEEFISSGLVHIIAVSGGNILMLVLFVSAVLFFLPFYVKNTIVLVLVIFYAFLCGMDSSVMRASLMGGMSLFVLFRGKEIQIWRGLTIAFVFMLLVNPYFLVYDVGFLLSFSAIVGLIFFQSYISKKREAIQGKQIQKEDKKTKKNKIGLIKKAMNNYLYPTLGASIGVFPILMFFMGKMNLLGIIGNIFILPLIPFVMIYGLISVYLHDMIAWSWFLQIERRGIDYIYWISHLISKYGIYVQLQHQLLKYILLGGALFGFVIWRKKEKNINSISTHTSVHKTQKDIKQDSKKDRDLDRLRQGEIRAY